MPTSACINFALNMFRGMYFFWPPRKIMQAPPQSETSNAI